MLNSRRRLLLYLIPTLIGFGGVLLSRQFTDLGLRASVLLLSIAVPVFAAGNLLASYRTGRAERAILFLGVLLLLAGAGFTLSGIADDIFASGGVPPAVGNWSRIIGMLSLLLGVCTIVATLVRTGEDIQAVGERFWHLAEHITEGFILSKPDGTILLVNKQFLDMSGLREEEVIGKNSYDLAQRLDVEPMQDHLRKRARGIASEYEVSWVVKGEERRFWFNGSPIFDIFGRHSANLATVRDITEQHQLRERVERYAQSLQQLVGEQTRKLRQSEARFRQLLVSMNEGFLTLDENTHIVFANERICRMLGCERQALRGEDFFKFVEPTGKVRLLNLFARGATLGDTEARQEINLLTTSGQLVPVVVALTHIPDAPAGEPSFSMVVTSVGELKAMQRELEERARELERVNEELRMHDRAKDAFLSNVSHELRTPLSTIQGYVDMLESESLGTIEGAQRGALKVMQRNITRLLGLINEIIDFSRMEIRGITLSTGLFNVEKLAREAAASAHPGALSKDVDVFVEDTPASVFAWGDREKLAQVLGILLNNAVKFTPSNGTVSVNVTPHGNDLEVSVTDTGIGIDPAFHDKVFDKFFQVDSSKSRRYEGTGIGLSIAKSIVEAHHGRLSLHSQVGHGSTFTVYLPACVFEDALDAQLTEGLRGFHVLVVDESEAFSLAIGKILDACGIAVQFSALGYQVARTAEQFLPSLIILNDAPSDLLGQTTLSLLRQNPAVAGIPVLVCSAESISKPSAFDPLAHLVHFLPKPFTPESLVDRVRSILHEEVIRHDADVTDAEQEQRQRVMVVDNDPCFLEWVEMALQRRHIPCHCAPNVKAALPLVDQEHPDVIFISVDEPGSQAEELLEKLSERTAEQDVPLYLMTGMPAGVNGAHGAAGILKKPFAIEQMVSLIEGARRETVREPAESR